MKLKKIILITLLLLAIFTISAVSAAENITDEGFLQENPTEEIELSEDATEEIVSSAQEEIINETNAGTALKMELEEESQLNAEDHDFEEIQSMVNSANSNGEILLKGTYHGNGTEITINKALTIDGQGSTLKAYNLSRMFYITKSYKTTFKNIIFECGNTTGDGGAIWGNNYFVINCTFIGCSANNGGAMYKGTATDCTFIGCSANNGGAMYIGKATRCNFTNNSATTGSTTYQGSARDCLFNNGTIYKTIVDAIYETTVEYTTYVFMNNIDAYVGDTRTINITVRDYFGNIVSSGSVFVRIAGRILENKPLNDEGYVAFNHTFDIECSAISIDYYIQSHSTYINNLDNYTSLKVNVKSRSSSHNFCSLAETISESLDGDVSLHGDYTFDPSKDGSYINGITINKNIIIYGNNHTINGMQQSKIFNVKSGCNVIFRDINFVQGYSKNGGAISGGEAYNCVFKYNIASNNGGATYNTKTYNCYFIYNRAKNGGAMYGGTSHDSNFTQNYATQNGGAIRGVTTYNGNFTMNRMYCYGESVSGGAAYGSTIYNSYFSDNRGYFIIYEYGRYKTYGGAVASCTVYDSTFISNSATSGGSMSGGNAYNCTFILSRATDGGAANGGTAYNSTFINCTATQNGGAMAHATANACIFIGNDAYKEGNSLYSCNIYNNWSFTTYKTYGPFTDPEPEAVECNYYFEYNVIVEDVLNSGGYFNFNVKVTDYAGQPLNGQTISFDYVSTHYSKEIENGYANFTLYTPYDYEETVTVKCSNNHNPSVTAKITTKTNLEYKTFKDLNDLIVNASDGDVIELTDNYIYDHSTDSSFESGIPITKNLTINGNNKVINNFYHHSELFNIDSNVTLIINNVKFTQNFYIDYSVDYYEDYSEYAIYNAKGNVEIHNSTFESCKDYLYNVTIYNCNFIECDSHHHLVKYGSIYNSKFINCKKFYGISESYCVNCTFINCTTRDSDLVSKSEILNATFINCSSARSVDYKSTVYNSAFINCSAMHGTSRISTVYNSTFINCSATKGGATYETAVSNSIFISCSATDDGGAMYGGSAINSTFINCSATDGGVNYESTVYNSTFINCSAINGGALYRGSCENSTFINCSAINGGATYETAVSNSLFISCSANDGGSVYTGSVVNSTFINSFADYGGAVYGGSATNSTFTNCSSGLEGGALYNTENNNCSIIDTNENLNYNHTIKVIGNTFSDIQKYIDIARRGNTILLIGTYTGDGTQIHVNKKLNIIGMNAILDANGSSVILNVDNLKVENIIFINVGNISDGHCSIYKGNVVNSTFINCYDSNYILSYSNVTNCKFINCSNKIIDYSNTTNCTYINCHSENCPFLNYANVSSCEFIDCYSNLNKGGILKYCSVTDSIFSNCYNICPEEWINIWFGVMEYGVALNSTFINCSANYGGAIYEGSATNSTFINCSAKSRGGAMYGGSATGSIFINCSARYGGAMCDGSATDSTFINCSATDLGGAMSYGSATDSIFINCSAADEGGALGVVSAINSIFINCSATEEGGAIWLSSAINSTFINCSAIYGGAIYKGSAINSTFINCSATDGGANIISTVYNSTFINCSAARYGGVMYGGSATNSTFINCSATIRGGAMWGGSAINSTFINCSATEEGGAMYGGSAINSTFINCSANQSGAMDHGSATDSTFINCSAADEGGAMRRGSATNSTFINCSAANRGGAMYEGSAINSTFINCSAANRGGAIYDGSAINSTFINCSAADEGGIMYYGSATGSVFINCSANYGGAMYYGSAIGSVFINCSAARYGGAKYYGSAINSTFINCSATIRGGAIYYGSAINSTIYLNPTDTIDSAICYQTYDKIFDNFNFILNYDSTLILLKSHDYKTDNTLNMIVKVISTDYVNEGNVTLSINGRKLTTAGVINGFSNITYKCRESGTFSVLVTYESEKYPSATTTFTLTSTCEKSEPEMDIKVDNGTMGLVSIQITLDEDATGEVSLSMPEEELYTTTNNGVAVFNITELSSGNYSAIITYHGNEIYKSANRTVEFTITGKKATTVRLHNLEAEKGEYLNITASVNSSDIVNEGYVTFIINGENIGYSNVSNGQAIFNYLCDKSGEFEVSAIFTGVNDYGTSNTAAILTVHENNAKTETRLLVDASNVPVGDDVIINVELVDKDNNVLNDFVKVYLNGALHSELSASSSIVFSDLISGDYNVYIEFEGNDQYKSCNASATFSVLSVPIIQVTPAMYVYISNCASGEDISVAITLPGDATGSVTIIIDNNTINCKLINGTVNLNIPGLAAGDYDATVYYSGDLNYLPTEKTTAFTVAAEPVLPKIDAQLNVDASNIIVGQNATIFIQVNPSATGFVNIKGKDIEIINGTAVHTISGLKAGEYSIIVLYKGDENFMPSKKIVSFTVDKANLNLEVTANSVDYGSDVFVQILSDFALNGNIYVRCNDEVYIVEMVDGLGNVTCSKLDAGSYPVVVSFDGDENFLPVTKVVSFTVDKAILNLEVTANNVSYGSDVFVQILSDFALNGNIYVRCNDEVYIVEMVDGLGNVTCSKLDAGSYPVVVSFDGDENFLPVTKVVSFTVDKANLNLDVTANNVSYGSDVFVQILSDFALNGNVNVECGGEVYIVEMVDGLGNVTCSKLDAGSYPIVVSFDGDENFLPVTINKTVQVYKVNPSIIVPNIEYYYGASGNTAVTVDAADEISFVASVNGHPEATIDIKNNIITISGLAEGSYTLSVTTVPTNNYNSITETANVDVNKVIITSDNFNKFVNENGELIEDLPEVILNGNFANQIFNINKPVHIIGRDARCMDSKFIIKSDNVTIENVMMQHSSSDSIVVANGVSNFMLANNTIEFTGQSDNSYAINIANSSKVSLINNEIHAEGIGYVHGILVSADEFNIYNNTVHVSSTENACGINIYGPCKGSVENNNLEIKAEKTVYSINTNPSNGNVQVRYIRNNINSEAYFVVGIYDDSESIKGNTMKLTGNYAIGIVVLSSATVENNIIILNTTNEGVNDEIHDDEVNIETSGIVVKNDALITNNTINSTNIAISILKGESEVSNNNVTGYINVESNSNTISKNLVKTDNDYAIVLKASACDNTIDNNELYANEGNGNEAIANNGANNQIANEQLDPKLKINIGDFDEDSSSLIIITTDKNYTGNVDITIIGTAQTYRVNVVNGNGNTTIKDLKSGSYTAEAISASNDNFKEGKSNCTFTVNPKVAPNPNPTPAQTQVQKPAPSKAKKVKLTLKAVKVKKSAKKLTLKATLKINGKTKKGLKVIFKFNGRKYIGKTNAKGIAKVTIKKSVLKKLKVGKKIKCLVKHGDTTVKKTLKVKK